MCSLRAAADDLQDDLVRLRRDLHREPEVGLELPKTQEKVLAALDGLPLKIRTGTSLSSLGKLKTPDAYAEDPAEAVTLFCGRFLQLMVWEPQVRTCRLSIAEAERLPGSSNAYFDAMFASTYERLTTYLVEQYGMERADSAALAEDLLGRAVLPRLFRTLLNVEDVIKDAPGDRALAEDVDLDAIRRLVSTALPG